jgi:hypothetical protein
MRKVETACTEFGIESVVHAAGAAHVFGSYCEVGRAQARFDAAFTSEHVHLLLIEKTG